MNQALREQADQTSIPKPGDRSSLMGSEIDLHYPLWLVLSVWIEHVSLNSQLGPQ